MSPNERYAGTLPRIRAVLESRRLYEIGADLQTNALVGRPNAHPTYLLLIFGVLARITRSMIRVETDLADPDVWDLVRRTINETLRRENLDLPAPGARPPQFHHWRRLRDDHLATDEGLATIANLHLDRSVDLARALGLLRPDGRSSLTHPSQWRTVVGDGTVVRPMYRPPETIRTTDDSGAPVTLFIDPSTGTVQSEPTGRYDADIAEHRGHAGPALGHSMVGWHVRGPGRYERVMLHLGHVTDPGGEAATAVQLLGDLYRVAGSGIQVAVYDGAFRGVHIDEIMRRYGYLVIAKQPTFADNDLATTPLVMTPEGKRVRSISLGAVEHQTSLGPCQHTLGAIHGAVVELELDDAGDPVVTSTLKRGSVKRARRKDGRYHFNIGYHLPCPLGSFDVWLSPHPSKPGDPRAEALRVFPEGDPDNLRLRGLRSDAESVHSGFKRTLLVDRAMSLGWRRGLLDYYCYAWYSNALAEQALRNRTRVGASQGGLHAVV